MRFDSADRWQEGNPPKRIPWSAHLGGYRFDGGVRIPTELSATWHEPEGDFTYVKGTISAPGPP